MTTLQQTVEIPADHRLFIDVPEEIPAGTATFRLEWIKPPEKLAVPLLSLRGSCKGLDTMDAYFERKRADKTLEEELEPV